MPSTAVITLSVKGTDLPTATNAVRGLFRSYLSRNPNLPEIVVDADAKHGEIAVSGMSVEEILRLLGKAGGELAIARGWTIRFEVAETSTAAVELPQSEVTEATVAGPPELSGGPRRASQYVLLTPESALQSLARVSKEQAGVAGRALRDLASGEWEKWTPETTPGFVSWREEDDHQALFSLTLPNLGTLVWERRWSVDLLGRITYPAGAYSETTPPPAFYAPHVVLRALVEAPKQPAFQWHFEGALYKEVPGLNADTSFYRREPLDEVAYKEELYLLSTRRIEDVLSGQQIGLPLHLSEEQVGVLAGRGPALLSGEAGSGKTSVITQWLVINHLRHQDISPVAEPLRQLFVTFSDRLREHTRFQFEVMLPPGSRVHRAAFRTYGELLEEIARIGGFGAKYPSASEMTFERFMRGFGASLPPAIDPVLLWDEIRSVIKGGVSSEADVLLDLASYGRLSEERGQCKTPAELREKYYEAAQKYQNHLLRTGMWDALDLVRACLAASGKANRFDRIACDEVQDLAPLEILLLLRLLENKDLSNLFFTGDIAQVINPSGFQWSRLKGELGRLGRGLTVPDVRYLRRNYRSHAEIVELVNQVLMVRRDLLDDEVSKVSQIPLLPARIKPMALRTSPMDLLKTVPASPIRRMILTKTLEQKKSLEKELGDAANSVTLLTIEEAKGLEFDGVLLWNFFVPRHEMITKNDWEQVFIPAKRNRLKDAISTGRRNPYGLTYEFNLLHVGLTRARRLLFMYDESALRLTSLGEDVAQAVAPADSEDFRVHWATDVASPEEFFQAASRLINRDSDQARRLFLLAAAGFEKGGNLTRAAECFGAADEYDRAARCYKAAQDRPNELRAWARHHEKRLEWAKAGELYFECGDVLAKSGSRFEASEAYDQSRQANEKAGLPKEAARSAWHWAEALPLERAAERARAFADAAIWAQKAEEAELSIRAREQSLAEAGRARQAGKRIIPGEPVDDWIACQHIEIAELEAALRRHERAASAARKAAGLWMSLADTPDAGHRKPYFQDRCVQALAFSVEQEVSAGEPIQAAAIQKDLAAFLRATKSIDRAGPIWGGFARAYLEKREYDLYIQTVQDLASFLAPKEALAQLDEGIRMCEREGLHRLELELLGGKVKAAEQIPDWRAHADALKARAEVLERVGEPRKSVEDLYRSAMSFLRIDEKEKTQETLVRASRLASRVMTAAEQGWFRFKDIALDIYIPRNEYGVARRWIQEAADAFAQDIEESKRRLEGFLAEVEQQVNRLEQQRESAESPNRRIEIEDKRKQELRTLGWVQLALGMVLAAWSKLSGSRAEMRRASDFAHKSSKSFEDAGDTEASRIAESMTKIGT